MGDVIIWKKSSQEYGLNTMVNMVFLAVLVFCFMQGCISVAVAELC